MAKKDRLLPGQIPEDVDASDAVLRSIAWGILTGETKLIIEPLDLGGSLEQGFTISVRAKSAPRDDEGV